ncbi:unnamed protein product, partial [Coregonus sp. 'balchen']
CSAQAAVEDSERIFTELIRSIERKCSEVKELIRAQEKAEVSRAKGLLKQLDQEMAELRRREAELEQLSHTEDNIKFLQSSAEAAVKNSERIFTELIRSIERRRSEVKDLIRTQEKAEVSRAEGLLKQLDQEMAELRRRDTELEQLSNTEDNIQFLQVISMALCPQHQCSAQAAVEDSERIFTELIHSVDRRRSEVKELIRSQEKAEVSRAEGLLKQLDQEMAELRRRDTELEKLSNTEGNIQFLQ